MIREMAKSLSCVKDVKFDGCFMAKAELRKSNLIGEITKYEVDIEKMNDKLSIINSKGYGGDGNLCAELRVYLIHKAYSRKNIIKNQVQEYKNFKYFRIFKKEEVYDFSKYTDDINSIHLIEKPIVQGLFIMSEIENYLILKQKHFKNFQIKFLEPIYSDEEIYMDDLDDIIIGYSGKRLCFKTIINKL